MILFPAIDLKDGVCVRLEQGDMARATVFNRDPASQAHTFEAQGFRYLHLVDLDGAFAGKPMNAGAVERILETVSIPVQLGGGIRDMATVEAWLGKGVTRVIIGTAAVRDPGFVREAGRRFPGRVAVGLDARDGKVAVEGWAATSELTALDIARRFGKTYYGCCEALHQKIDILRKIKNLRKISVSPWFDIPKGLEDGAGDYILSIKPNPAIFAEDGFNEERARAEIAGYLDQAKGQSVELVMKDISTLRHDPARLDRWAQIAMEEAEKRG